MKKTLLTIGVLSALLIVPTWSFACETDLSNLSEQLALQGEVLSSEDLIQVKSLFEDAATLCGQGNAISSVDKVAEAYAILDAYPASPTSE